MAVGRNQVNENEIVPFQIEGACVGGMHHTHKLVLVAALTSCELVQRSRSEMWLIRWVMLALPPPPPTVFAQPCLHRAQPKTCDRERGSRSTMPTNKSAPFMQICYLLGIQEFYKDKLTAKANGERYTR